MWARAAGGAARGCVRLVGVTEEQNVIDANQRTHSCQQHATATAELCRSVRHEAKSLLENDAGSSTPEVQMIDCRGSVQVR